MGERKVQAKYYPPDFDPEKLPRIKKKRQNDDAVRFMLPMSVRCETCGEFMGTGLKFNARKSDTDENYLGIRIFRFSMKCKGCPASFTIKTDPKNSDYTCESGVRRNYEPWRAAKNVEEEGKEERKRQDEDAIQALENKTRDAKQEMEELDALDELKSLKAKRATVDVDDILAKGRAAEQRRVEEAEQDMLNEAKLAFERKRNSVRTLGVQNTPTPNFHPVTNSVTAKRSESQDSRKNRQFGLKIVKRIKKTNQNPHAKAKSETPGSGLVGYGSSSSDDD